MKTENLSTLKIHKLSREQYERELTEGRIDESALYLVPDEEEDSASPIILEEVSRTYETKSDAAAKLEEAKTYADEAAMTVKDDLLNGAGDAYDTLKELGELIDNNQDALDALSAIADGKAAAEHDHVIADVTGLQDTLNGIANTYETKSDALKKIQAANEYTDEAIALAKEELAGNIGADPETIKYTPQHLSEEEKAQARANIGIEFSDENALDLLAEVGIITPTVNEEGLLFVDEDGAIYSVI